MFLLRGFKCLEVFFVSVQVYVFPIVVVFVCEVNKYVGYDEQYIIKNKVGIPSQNDT